MASGSATRCDVCERVEFNQGDDRLLRGSFPPEGWIIVSVVPGNQFVVRETTHLCSTECLLVHARRADSRRQAAPDPASSG